MEETEEFNNDFEIDPSAPLEDMEIDWSYFKEKRLSEDQIKESSTLVIDEDLKREALDLLEHARVLYENLQTFRDRRKESRDYYIGEQWNGKITDPDTGEEITEHEYILKQGKIPLKQNQIRQVVKNLLGQFRDNDNTSTVIARSRENQKIGEMLTKSLQYALQANKNKELDVRQFEEFLISGYFAWKTSYGYHSTRNIDDVILDTSHANRMFFTTGITDIRLKEIDMIGELLDVRLEDLLKAFAKNDADAELIRQWYGRSRDNDRNYWAYSGSTNHQDSDSVDNIDFYNPDDNSKCRVYEMWKKKNEKVLIVHDRLTGKVYESNQTPEQLDMINEGRLMQGLQYGVPEENIPLIDYEVKFEDIWYFWFLTPQGDILQHGRTPYDHEETPYTLGLYPLVDGNIFGLVHDIKDQQRQINRLLTLMDFIISASAKGLLMIPEDSIPAGWTEDDFADQWTKSNGVIVYKPSSKNNAKPEQISSNSVNIGAMEMLQIQFNLLKEISGVTEAIQGHRPNSGTPSSLYAQQTHNATLSNRDYFEFFFSRRKERDFKIVKLQQQFYDEDRNIAIGGKDFDDDINWYVKDEAKDLEFDMVIGQSTTSQAYRQIADEWLMQFFQMGAIDLDTMLENTSMPFADKLRVSINKKQEELQAMQSQMGGQPDPMAMQMANQFAGIKQNQNQPGFS
jgi:hypothetical protein